MRATRAYITSFGTTGLLVASALLTLSVMSAFVAFNGFPGQDVQDPIGTLLVRAHGSTVTVSGHPVRETASTGRRHAAGRRAAKRRSGRGLARTGPAAEGPSPSSPTGTRAPTSSPQPSGVTQPSGATQQSGGTQQTGSVTQQLTGGGTPSLPSTQLPSAPSVPLPTASPPIDTKLPVDTSGVTGALTNP